MTPSDSYTHEPDKRLSGVPIPLDPVARFVFEESSEAILCVDLEDRITYWNRGAEELFGYREEEVLGHHFSFLIPDDAVTEELERISAGTEEGLIRRYETQRVTKDGHILTIQLTRTVLRSPSGEPIGYAALVGDVTPIKELTAQVARMERLTAMTKITAGVAHELRTPLGILSLTVDLLEESAKAILSFPDSGTTRREATKLSSLVEDMQREVGRLSEIVDHYLFLAQIRSPNVRPVELDRFMAEIAGDFRRRIVGRPVEFQYIPPASSSTVRLDPAQIRRLLYNLLDNALDAMPEGGTIILHTISRSDEMEVRFSDTGIGIDSDWLQHVFDPFETSKPTGSGLGLYIVKEIVTAHGGHVEIESRVDQGTTVIVRIPLSGCGKGTEGKVSAEMVEG